jgi:hypothetical protein
MLYDDILLNIFRHCLDATPQFWPTLGFVCQRWRQIILSSPLGLNLRLHCTHGTPVLKALACWPALPIVVRYGGAKDLDPPAPADDDNIIAALKESDRVSYISLTITRSLVEKLSAITEPIWDLEELTLLSRDSVQPALPSTFRWGHRLRTLESTGVAFPSFPQLLLPSQGLVDLHVHEIPRTGYFSPVAFANALSGMVNLRSLSLDFLSLPSRRSYLGLPPPSGARIVLPALTYLKYQGTSRYLDHFVARIDAPRLGDTNVTFCYQPTMDASQLGRFIERTEIQTLLVRAEVETSSKAIFVSFMDSTTCTPLRVQISCKRSDWQLCCMAQVCNQFSPFLCRVENLGVKTIESSTGQDDADGEQCLGLILAFGGAKNIHMAASGKLVTSILRALPQANGSNAAVLPALHRLRVEDPLAMNMPLWEAFQLSRHLSGHPIVELQILCYICENSFAQLQELKRHLGAKHGYRTMCSYCSDFECKSGQSDLFPEHLKNKHPEVACNDALISSRVIYAPDLRRLVDRHSSTRAPDTTTPSTTSPPSPVSSVFRPNTDDKFPGI